MSANNLSKEVENRLNHFLADVVDPKDMAKAIRQANYLLTLSVIRERDTLGKINMENFFYWINEMAEVLDPYFEAE
ncbi:hypothetical protein [Flavobacterium olei]|uniref:hypothetical protein n=1 Tax=Flavobacterium olei TaxID=1886782 RepID=UPI00321C1481